MHLSWSMLPCRSVQCAGPCLAERAIPNILGYSLALKAVRVNTKGNLKVELRWRRAAWL